MEIVSHTSQKFLVMLRPAALPLVGVSAWQALVENIGLSKDQKILIHGGAGGIGSIAIQLAKHLGAYVATTVSTNDKQFVQELGGNQVIDYKTQNFEDILHDYDAVFDTVAGETYRRSFKVLKKRRHNCFHARTAKLGTNESIWSQSVISIHAGEQRTIDEVGTWVDQNNISVNVEKTFLLDEAGKALDYQKDVHPRGKVVLTV